MILAELKKIKGHYLLPLSIGVVVLSCLLALIQLTGAENSVVGYLFPFLITFFGGFLMNREYAEDTLKSNLIIPVSYRKLIFAKIAVTLFVAVSFLCSIVFAVILRYPFNLEDVMPIIVLFTLKRNLFLAGTCGAFVYGFCGIFVANTRFTSWYPTTSGLTIINYEPNSSNYQMSAAIFVLAVCMFFSLLIITVARRNLYD